MAHGKDGRALASQLRFAFAVIIVAVLAAAFAIAFRSLLSLVLHHGYQSADIVSAFRSLPLWARPLVPFAGGILAGLTALKVAARSKSQGVGDVMEAVALGRTLLSMRVTLLKSLGSWLAIATGGSIGREGPLIQFGGSCGAWIGKLLDVGEQPKRALIAAGTAAGFAAAYNTPLAAVLFVLEIVVGIVALDAILPAVAATAISTAITRSIVGGGPIYGQRAFVNASQTELVAHAGLGVLAGLAAFLFMRLLWHSESWLGRSGIAQPWRAGLGGLFVGLFAIYLPEITGNGYEPLNAILDGKVELPMLLTLLVAKPIATSASVSSGSPGGVFTPSLLLGAVLGSSFWSALASVFDGSALGSPGSYALVGMAAVTAATTHAPMMAAVLVFELSGDYAIVLPLLLATTLATMTSRRLHPASIYTAELLRRGAAWQLTLEGRTMAEPDSEPKSAHR